MYVNYLLAIAAGLASSFFNLSVLTGGVASIFMSVLVSLPLFLSGLGLGTRGATISVLVAVIVNAMIGGFSFAGSFLLLAGIPALIISRQALLAKPAANGQMEWYPLGHLLTWLTGLVIPYAGTLLIFSMGEDGGAWGQINVLVTNIFEALSAEAPEGTPPLFDAAAIEITVRLIPAVMAAAWMFGIVVDAALAQVILRRVGRNIRQDTDIVDIRLPNWLAAGFLAALVLAVWGPGDLSFFGTVVSGAGALAYFFQGLAVVHALARNMRVGRLFLIPFYVLLFIFVGWLPLMVFGLGLIDQAVDFRSRMSGGGSDQEDE
jgi:hypothetical protein